jgi:hypothetical protein
LTFFLHCMLFLSRCWLQIWSACFLEFRHVINAI